MNVTVNFANVGRGKRCWSAVLPVLDERLLLKEIRKNGGLASRDVDVAWDAEQQSGTIYVGGFRAVGTFTAVAA